ncbi:zinc finger protein 420-like isoform X2 [Armigeres subalbatus]|uniref:zinc finger protein 420-like isoform X2 n=1 Tax=Armigeres subalbatus TaxID=124917 RepID=UPI002ED1215C
MKLVVVFVPDLRFCPFSSYMKELCPDRCSQILLTFCKKTEQDSSKIKLEIVQDCESVYEYEFLDEVPDESTGQDKEIKNGILLKSDDVETSMVLGQSDNDDNEGSVLSDSDMEDEIVLEDEDTKFPFVVPSEERIAQRLIFDDFEYLEIDGDRCCGCSFIAANRDELIQHSKDNHSQNYYADSGYTCPTCYQKFQSQERLTNHIEYYSYNDVFLCTICNESFVQKNQLKLHQDSKPLHQLQKLPVKQKFENSKRNASYKRHTLQMKQSENENTQFHYCCFVRCWEGFNTEDELLTHVFQAHEGKRRENELASSKNPDLIKFTCTVCQRSYESEKQLLVHVSYKQKRDEYICQQCGKCFFKSSHLRDHEQKYHNDFLPEFACDICGKTFRKLSVLKNHQKIHVPFENVPCSETGCGMVFRDTALMKRHCRNVHGETPWQCRFCPKKLRTKEAMDIHERVHTGEKPFHCRQGCDRKFAHATDRVRHERSMHTSEKPHKCQQCNGAFVRRRELVIHTRKHHSEQLSQHG